MSNNAMFGGKSGSEKKKFGGVIGVGYISIMLIFTVICLTIFAVLSFQAAYSNNQLSGRSEEFTQKYYAADAAAKKTLAELDRIAAEAQNEFSFEDSFSEAASELDGISLTLVPEGVRADYTEEINEQQKLSVSVVFFRNTAGERYRIINWKNTSEEISADDHQNVWDGGDLV